MVLKLIKEQYNYIIQLYGVFFSELIKWGKMLEKKYIMSSSLYLKSGKESLLDVSRECITWKADF